MKADELIKYLKSLGLEVHTSTKARGHQGFYIKNRIDISKNISPERIIPTLLHEFAHYEHSLIEPFMERTGGTLNTIFDTKFANLLYLHELISVTNFVDKHSKFEKLINHKKQIKLKIAEYESIIKEKYPKFQRSKSFTPFNKYIKKSNARYLLKYDRVKICYGLFFPKTQLLTIDNIEKDFSDMPEEFAAYIRLNSCRKKQSRISAKINKLNKYYMKPTELFARFVEGLYIDKQTVKNLAPNTYARFFELVESNYYPHLKNVLTDYIPNNP